MKIRLLIHCILALLITGLVLPANAQTRKPVHVLTVEGMIEPAVARYVDRGIKRAEEANAEAVVINLDTPGGLYEPMRQIVQNMLNSKVPVIVYVSPNGARAASAGAFIMLAANVAAMAPVTNVGSAHPVLSNPTGGDTSAPDDTMMKKVVNDSAKYIVTIADKRGRNAKWAEKAVRDSDNITAKEAVKMNVADFVANNLREVLTKADGMKVQTEAGTITLHTRNAPIENYPMGWTVAFLQVLANPIVAFLLMLAAIYGIIFEISNPGAIVPGVVGGISIILLLYSFSVLPLNIAGLVLILLAVALFIAEAFIISHGVLTIGGVIAFFVGSLMVFGSGTSMMRVPIAIIAAGTLATAAFFIFLMGMGLRALKRPVVTGREAMVGLVVAARTDIAPVGKIFAEGTWWTAETEGEPIIKGEMVKITEMNGLKVRVVKASDNRKDVS